MIYLDNAATSFPKAPGVADSVARQISEGGGSAGRSSHGAALDASRLLFAARAETAALFGLSDSARLVFTKNATEALNLAILGAVPDGGTVLTSALEHNSVMRPLRYLESERGVSLRFFSCDPEGLPDPAELEAGLRSKPDLVVFTAASNVSGAVLPYRDIVARCRALGIPVCVDASQLAGHRPLDADALGADYLCFPGHKGLLGPGGTGCLLLGPEAFPLPLLRGGTGSASESEDHPDLLPDRYEAGTHNLPGLAGLLAAVRYLAATGIARIGGRERAASDRLAQGLSELPGLRLVGPALGRDRVSIVSLAVEGMDLGDFGRELDRAGVACRVGLHCAPAAHRSLGTFSLGGTIRLSPGHFTTDGEIDAAVDIIKEILS